jgi:3'-phosphoadenosine 5'-phosphosulfate sulfotransferase (PAPS reductase)/FAD synthetase
MNSPKGATAVVCHYSGGVSSFLAAKRAVEKYGRDAVTLLFCDTGEESEGLYRFLEQGVDFLGAPFVRLAYPGGMDALIDAEGAIPNNRMAFCTRKLKREMGDAWVAEVTPARSYAIDAAARRSHSPSRSLH